MGDPRFELSFATAEETLSAGDTRLVDVIDSLLDHGVVIRGELWLTVADVDLVFLGLDLVLCNPDRITGARRAS
jgi:hypothetical protein